MQIFNVNKKKEHIPVMVFKNKNNSTGKDYYTLSISKKDGDKYVNGYIPAVFNKDVKLENKDRIILKNSTLDFYKTEEKETKYFIRVFEFDKLEPKETETDSLPF